MEVGHGDVDRGITCNHMKHIPHKYISTVVSLLLCYAEDQIHFTRRHIKILAGSQQGDGFWPRSLQILGMEALSVASPSISQESGMHMSWQWLHMLPWL